MKAIIFNSGLGRRMGNLTKNKPKCMMELYNGETIFERQIRILSKCGINKFIITTGPYKEQLIKITKKYPNLFFSFVNNPEYMNTNYIVSMNYAYDLLDDDVLLLHGDLVFNMNLIKKILSDNRKSICLFNETKILPEKDFKGRFIGNVLKEVSISIFEENCYAFQPLYKLSKDDIFKWKNKAFDFVRDGKVNVYAEDALNEIINNMSIHGISYKDDYIEEIDNEEDYNRVSSEIKYFDYKEQNIEVTNNYIEKLKKHIDVKEKIFIVSSKSFVEKITNDLSEYDITIFSEYSPNPKYEEIKKGLNLFKKKNYKKIISLGGGSTIDVAKCIKIFSNMNSELDFLENKYIYNNIEHIAIPTTAGTGSESTQIAVMYYKNEKVSIDHGSILPNTAILDYSLLKTLPNKEKKSTLLDSLSQAIESYWANKATIESRFYAKNCISLILDNYEKYLKNDESCYRNILIASNYSGKAINISRTTAPHALSYKLTTLYNISHGYAVAICLIPCWKRLEELSDKDIKLKNILMSLALILNCKNIKDSIRKIENIINLFKLPEIKISPTEMENMVKCVNFERLKNNPVQFNDECIYEIYKEISVKKNR